MRTKIEDKTENVKKLLSEFDSLGDKLYENYYFFREGYKEGLKTGENNVKKINRQEILSITMWVVFSLSLGLLLGDFLYFLITK